MKKLLGTDPSLYTRPEGALAQPDRVPDNRAMGTPQALVEELAGIVGRSNVADRISDLVRYASDASPYRTVPAAVAKARNAADVAALMRWAGRTGHHIVFRAAGSSLNGQAMTDDVMVDVKTHFTGMKVLDGGRRIWSRPGVVLGDAQAVLARHGYMIGADPGSTSVACIGGIVADNSGGMRCTIERDSYHTIEDAVMVLASGTLVDTRDPHCGDKLAEDEPEIYHGLLRLRDEIRADDELVDLLRRKFSIRNTNGLRIDAFLDEDAPERILMKLMVGSEGIFGCLTEVVLRTVELPRVKATTWVILPDLKQAANYVHPLMQTGAIACELLVAPVMKAAVKNFPSADPAWEQMPDQAGALLLEVGGADDAELQEKIAACTAVLEGADLVQPLDFTSDDDRMRGAWQIRNGLFGLVGEYRRPGSTMITEDVCFPPAQIGEASAELLDLLVAYDYPPMVMGHAPFGNLHFFMTPILDDDKEREHYSRFLDDMAELVIGKYQGSLKAEHGTGVNMAPFVKYEWGDKAYSMFWKVKQLLDPQGILAPDVKLTRSQSIHLENFKSFPQVEEELSGCVECGMCEPVCPSRHVTVTPRHRIALRREMARQPEGSPVLEKLQEQYDWDAVQMCAADSTCAIACPVSIDTGKVMKQLRGKQITDAQSQAALTTARSYAIVEKAARASVKAANRVGNAAGFGLLKAAADMGRGFISSDVLPTVPGPLPQAASAALPHTSRHNATAVYFPACINRIFGNPNGAPADQLSITESVVELGRRSGAPVWIPDAVAGLCCGTPWSSKGYRDGFVYAAAKLAEALVDWSDNGRLPVIIDAASCTHGLVGQVPETLATTHPELAEKFARVEILDLVEWITREVIDHLPITRTLGTVAVHPTCSTMHLGIDSQLVALAAHVGDARVPDGAHCCGSAGDRVMLHPRLVESATREEREQLNDGFDYFVSDNRTCEMGLEMIAGKPYQSIACLLERASRPVLTH
ncbi:FAD-binding and (Fe-S)-binding domain-containing protein [Corynebacterium mendelii]|uniref:D-lactate dehydrogenase (cytochrome) n=1 Tax=Corynebacterium mendelii TaxID=2765362 RepID=A0A939DZ71_9CORY|nr:FAD-binding and (Fe-S)-binding domain-containing protein [Corynebacterium mendelii]MBN9643541.1 FAD-binding oxidoreductase [Corynebacterium mendelii]